jgi:hypothetical protein
MDEQVTSLRNMEVTNEVGWLRKITTRNHADPHCPTPTIKTLEPASLPSKSTV